MHRDEDNLRSEVEGGCRRTYVGGMFFAKVDAWVGKTLFIPPIIKLCQVTGQSQFALSRLFWFIAALDGFYRAETWFASILWGGLSIFMMITATRRADAPTASYMFFRMLGLLFLVLDLLVAAGTGKWAGVEFWVLVLIAEYAATIRIIPPAESAKTRMSHAPSRK